MTYGFQTRVRNPDLSGGDVVAETRTEATFEETSVFGDDATAAMETPVVYGETADPC